MGFDSFLDFNCNKIRRTIVPPMSPTCPVEGRKYTMYSSNITGEYFITVSNRFCKDAGCQLIRNDVFAEWALNDCGAIVLYVYIDLGDENSLLAFSKYIMFKRLIPNYLRTILHGDREFFRQNKCLLNRQIRVHFMSECTKFNTIENYGTLRNYR